MATFEYQVIDRDGKMRRGQADSLQEEFLRRELAQQGLFVVGIQRVGGGVAAVTLPTLTVRHPVRSVAAATLKRLLVRVRVADLLLFTSQLAVMVEAGLHLLKSLRALASETTNRQFRKSIEQVASDVESGSSFADALERHPWAFNKVYVSLARVGESASQLSAALKQLTIYLEKSASVRRKVVGALAYPSMILSVVVIMFLIVLLKIVPMFETIYSRLNATLPPATLALLRVSQAIQSHFLVIVIGLAIVSIALYIGIPADRARYMFDRFKLRLPGFGPLIRKAVLAKFCRTLSILTQSGVPLLEALRISAEAAENRVLEDALRVSIVRVREGSAVSDALRRSGQFPSLVTQMVATGEESGQLAAMLEKSAFYYEQQVDAAVNTLSTLIEPVLIVIVGIIAGLILFALYMPIFNLGAALRGGAGKL